MSRAAVLSALRGDTELNTLVPPSSIITNYSQEGRPSNIDPGPFLILRWGDQRFEPSVRRGPRDLTIWIHVPEEISTDYDDIDEIIPVIERVLLGIDDDSVTEIRPAGGASGDLVDPGFRTIVRTVSYEVLSRTA